MIQSVFRKNHSGIHVEKHCGDKGEDQRGQCRGYLKTGCSEDNGTFPVTTKEVVRSGWDIYDVVIGDKMCYLIECEK